MIDKDSLPLDRPRRTPDHPTKSHVVKTKVDGKERIIRFGEQGAETAGKPRAGESERMKAKRASFKARHAKNIAKGKSSPAYWADKVKWAEGGAVGLRKPASPSDVITDLMGKVKRGQSIREQEEQQLESMRRLLSSRRLGSARRSPLTELRSTDPTTPISSSPPPESVEPSAGAGTPQPVQVVQPVSSAALNKPAADNPYYAEAVRLAEKYNLPAGVFVSLVNQESRFNPEARSPKGAIGLGQLMPGTAKELGVDPTDPLQNLDGAARYLRQQIDRFGSVPLALAAYNAGPGNVRKYGGIPPFKETQNYVAQVMKGAGGEQPGFSEGGKVSTYKRLTDTLSKMVSLDTPQDMTTAETVADIAAGFVPGVGTAQAARDFERARREGDRLGMGLAGAGMIPVVGGMVKPGKAAVKSLGELVDQYVRKVRKMDELGPPTLSVHRVEAPASAEVPGWHITQDLSGILETGAMTNKAVGDRNMQGWIPAHVGGAYFYSDPRLARAKWEDVAEMLGGDRALAAEMPIIRAQLRRGNRLVPDEDVSLKVPWQQSYQEGSFATMRPVLINQIDRIYSADPGITKDMIRDTVVRQRRYAEGGEVEAEIKATPQNPVLGGLARGVKSVQELASKYSLPEAIPLVGGMGVDELLGLPGAARETERWSYGNYPIHIHPYAGRTAAVGYVPTWKSNERLHDTLDTALLAPDALGLGKLGIKYGTRGALAAGKQLEGIAERAVPQIMERGGAGAEALLGLSGGTRSQVIKPKGGNWLAGYIDNAVGSLKTRAVGQDPARRLQDLEAAYAQNLEAGVPVDADFMTRQREALAPDIAVNKWLDTKLRKYIQNEMGTPEDPIRKLADEGKLHFEPEPRTPSDLGFLYRVRQEAGAPAESLAKTDLGAGWEERADFAINAMPAGRRLSEDKLRNYKYDASVEAKNPWLAKVPPETPTYSMIERAETLGFDHLVDEMRNAMRPDTDLPARLRIDPAKLEKMTVPQIVEKVSQINAWRAEQQAAANAAKAMNPATQVVKEYPDQGYKWVELKQPTVSDVLPEGWSEPVKKGNALQTVSPNGDIVLGSDLPELVKNIYKRHPDTPGNPRKALEDALKYEGDVMGHCVGGYCPDVAEGRSRIFSLRDSKGEPHVTVEVQPGKREGERAVDYRQLTPENYAKKYGDDSDLTERIVQIKGKANRAPKEEYLPFVQDFVKSQNWSDVGDIQNTGLISSKTLFRDSLDPVWNRVRNAVVEKHPNATMSKEDVKQLIGNDYITEQEAIDRLSDYFKKAGYAAGGLVSAYNPEAVDAVVNQILEGAYV